MFEDSIFESAGRIHTRSHEWMIAAFAFNASILLAFVMIPLIFPPALPHQVSAFLMEVFVPPNPSRCRKNPRRQAGLNRDAERRACCHGRFRPTIFHAAVAEQQITLALTSLEDPNNDLFKRNVEMTVVRPVEQPRQRVSSGTVEGLLIQRTAAGLSPHSQGNGNQRHGNAGGHHLQNRRHREPARHQRADDVAAGRAGCRADWRYRPYLLNAAGRGETTVSVIFTMQR